MRTVTSADGTPIAVWESGSGPPLVLVHGTTADHSRWSLLLPFLERHCTVHAVDRRGRGGSGDSLPYAITREGEDLVAVMASIGEPATLMGHSYGAVCSLDAAQRGADLRGLVLYEPPELQPAQLPGDFVTKMERQLAEGDREGAVLTFFREIVGMPEEQLGVLRAHAAWPARIAAAHTIPRELATEGGYRVDTRRLGAIRGPVTLLEGERSPDVFKRMNRKVRQAVPASRLMEMSGQQHVAMDTAPEAFARLLLACVRGDQGEVEQLARSMSGGAA